MKNGAKFENNKGRLARITVIIAAIAIMTTSLAVGTFAKYATGDNTSDTARVAKWGVTVDINVGDGMFAESYDGTVVSASESVNVVAPGTKNDTGVTFTITGKPEVRSKVLITITDKDGNNPKDVFLHLDGKTTYYPVKFTLVQTSSASGILPDYDQNVVGEDGILVKDGTLADVQAVLTAYSGTEYAPNTDLAASFKLTWKWDFGNDDDTISGNDIYDTALGDLAAGLTVTTVDGVAIDADDYNLWLDYKINITIVQVD